MGQGDRGAGLQLLAPAAGVEIERTESGSPKWGEGQKVAYRSSLLFCDPLVLSWRAERRVCSYQRAPTRVYYVAQNMEPVILRRKRPKTVYAVSRINNNDTVQSATKF